MSQVQAQGIRGCPTQVFGDVDRQDADHLLDNGDADEHHGQVPEQDEVPTGAGDVDKGPHDLGVYDLQADADEQGEPKEDSQVQPGFQVAAEEADVLAEGEGLFG